MSNIPGFDDEDIPYETSSSRLFMMRALALGLALILIFVLIVALTL